MAGIEVFNLAELSRSFATRMKGKEVAGLLSDVIARNDVGTVVVGWNGVSAASPSFIDEFINGIQEAVQRESCRTNIVFTCEDSEVVTLVDTILRRREFPVRYAATSDDLYGGSVSTLGGPSNQNLIIV